MSSQYATRLSAQQKRNMDFGRCGDAEIQEHSDSILSKVKELANLMRNSRRCVIFTGAGISTSAGILDFRGVNGVWTNEKKRKAPPSSVSFEKANPTQAHLVIVALMKAGFAQHVVTQNLDGLHVKSGVPREQLSEIHGSFFAKYCYECGTEYPSWKEINGFGCKKIQSGDVCPRLGCGQSLHDRVCDWTNILPIQEMHRAEMEHQRADLVIVLGSSLRMHPANDLVNKTLKPSIQGEDFLNQHGQVEQGKKKGDKGHLVIVNLQATRKEYDTKASVRIYGKCDEVMTALAHELGVAVPPWNEQECKAMFQQYHDQIVVEAQANFRTRNNGRWKIGYPCLTTDDICCYVCGKNDTNDDNDFLLCSLCDCGVHRQCTDAVIEDEDADFFCLFCVNDQN